MPDISLALIIIFLIAAVIFLAPFHISMDFSKYGPLIQGSYRIGWLGITLLKGKIFTPVLEETKAPSKEFEEEITEGTTEVKAKEDTEREAKEMPKEESKPHLTPGPSIKEMIETLPALARVFIDLIKSINIERISCQVSLGLDDPADTAVISGYLWSLASVIGQYRANIYIEPYFEGERLDGSLLADMKAQLLWIALVLVKALKEEKIRRLIIDTARKGQA